MRSSAACLLSFALLLPVVASGEVLDLEPSSKTGLPVAVNVVWIVAHTTVRATKGPLEIRALRAARKRTA